MGFLGLEIGWVLNDWFFPLSVVGALRYATRTRQDRRSHQSHPDIGDRATRSKCELCVKA
ncbi:MAG: hypothetical protein F6K56_41330 [Moorea sp. SIO3G5]|nr:hypothetical protein [Moorena sp. SIO3G5]